MSFFSRLFGKSSPSASTATTAPISAPRGTAGAARRTGCQEIDPAGIPCLKVPREAAFPLPPGELPKGSAFHANGPGWTISRQEKFPKGSGPDPMFKLAFAFRDGFFFVKRYEKSGVEGWRGSTVDVLNRDGSLRVRRETEDLFRMAAHTEGTVLSDLGFYGRLAAFDADIQPIWNLDTTKLPMVQNRAKSMRLGDRDPFRMIKDADVSSDGSKALVGAIDQVWCLTPSGEPLWGLQMPIKKNWLRIETAAAQVVPEHIKQALEVLGLSFPATLDEIKTARKTQAMKWHPDVSSDPKADERMKAINDAYRVITGVDPDDLQEGSPQSRFVDKDTYSKEEISVEVDGQKVGLSIEFSLSVGEATAADWLTYVRFSGDGKRAYAATSSGILFEISDTGEPLQAYELSCFPYGFQEAFGRLYLNMEDHILVLGQGKVLGRIPASGKFQVMSFSDFVLVWADNRADWLTADGVPIGHIIAKGPIRRVYSTPDGWAVETRQNRCILVGPPI